MNPRMLLSVFLVLTVLGSFQIRPKQSDTYDALLHSQSLENERTALMEILRDPDAYVPRIQDSLRNYPELLQIDSVAANRAIYVAVLVRDPSFPPILAQLLRDKQVVGECEYACPVVFALTIDSCFAGWSIPSNLDSKLTTVSDLRATIKRVPRITLQTRPIEDVVQGPSLERHRAEIEGKTEEQLIQIAGPRTPSSETRLFAALKLETSVSTSKNLIELYLLAMNDVRDDAYGEYRDAVYESIYRAELSKVGAKSR
jgi:hypothetical protein